MDWCTFELEDDSGSSTQEQDRVAIHLVHCITTHSAAQKQTWVRQNVHRWLHWLSLWIQQRFPGLRIATL